MKHTITQPALMTRLRRWAPCRRMAGFWTSRRMADYWTSRRMADYWICRRGAAAVEFAIIFPVFLVMVLGIVEVGRAMWIKSSMQFAVEQAARYALVYEDKSDAEIKTYAEESLASSGMTGAGIVVSFSVTAGAANGVTFSTVSATHTFEPFVEITSMPTFTLSASSRTPRNE